MDEYNSPSIKIDNINEAEIADTETYYPKIEKLFVTPSTIKEWAQDKNLNLVNMSMGLIYLVTLIFLLIKYFS